MKENGFPLPITLPELAVTPSVMQVFMFSAATWNRHHIHYDRSAAIAEGLQDIAVQRALIGNYFARMLTRWLGERGEIKRIAWKMLRPAYPGHTLRCQGFVVGRCTVEGCEQMDCTMSILDDSEQAVATSSAVICIHDIS